MWDICYTNLKPDLEALNVINWARVLCNTWSNCSPYVIQKHIFIKEKQIELIFFLLDLKRDANW